MDAEMIRTLKEVRDALKGINKSLHHIAEMMEPVRNNEDQIDVSMRGLMKRWNYITRKYDDYTVPESWRCTIVESEMNKEINCARCGKKILFGDGYTSRWIHSDSGFGYTVCIDCHEKEYEEERAARDEL